MAALVIAAILRWMLAKKLGRWMEVDHHVGEMCEDGEEEERETDGSVNVN